MKERAELSGYTVVDPPSVVATHLTEIIKKHAHELLGRQETKTLVENVKESYPALVDDLIPCMLSIGMFRRFCRSCLERKFPFVIWLPFLKLWLIMVDYTKDPEILTEYVRQAFLDKLRSNMHHQGIP